MLSGPCHWDPSRYLTDLAWAVHQPSRNEPSSAPYSGQRPHFRDPLKLSSKIWSVINSVRVIVLLLSSQYHYTFQAAVRSLIGLCHNISSNKLQHSVQAISLCNTNTRTPWCSSNFLCTLLFSISTCILASLFSFFMLLRERSIEISAVSFFLSCHFDGVHGKSWPSAKFLTCWFLIQWTLLESALFSRKRMPKSKLIKIQSKSHEDISP